MRHLLIQAIEQAFSGIFVLTIHRNQARHKVLHQTLQGLNYTLLYGEDRKNLSMEALLSKRVFDPQRAKKYLKRPLKIGEIACALTHRHAYETALQQNLSSVLILEDDVDFVTPLPSIEDLQQAFLELPADWELCYLGCEKNQQPNRIATAYKKNFYLTLKHLGLSNRLERKIKNQYVQPLSKHLYRAGVHTGTHAYALSAAGCRKLYEKQLPVCMCADHLLNEMIAVEGLKAYVLKKKLFINKSGEGKEISSL